MDRPDSYKRRFALAFVAGCVCASCLAAIYFLAPSLNLWQYGLTATTSSNGVLDSRLSGRFVAAFSVPDIECGPACACCECWVEMIAYHEGFRRIFCIKLHDGRFKDVSISSSDGGLKSNDGSPFTLY